MMSEESPVGEGSRWRKKLAYMLGYFKDRWDKQGYLALEAVAIKWVLKEEGSFG